MQQHDRLYQKAFRACLEAAAVFFMTIILPAVVGVAACICGPHALFSGKIVAAMLAILTALALLSVGSVWLMVDRINRSTPSARRTSELRLLARQGRHALCRVSIFGLWWMGVRGLGDFDPVSMLSMEEEGRKEL